MRDFNLLKKLYFIVLLLPLGAWSLQIDWSGYYSVQETFLHEGDKKRVDIDTANEYEFVGNHRFALDGVARVSDGLTFNASLGFQKPVDSKKTNQETLEQPKKVAEALAKQKENNEKDLTPNEFIYPLSYSKRKFRWPLGEDKMPGLALTHFYTTYTADYFELTAGRMPYHFGLGMTYNEGVGHVLPAYDVRDGVAIEFQVEDIALKPYVIRRENGKLAVAVKASYDMDNMGIAALYENTLTEGSQSAKIKEMSGYSYLDMPTLNIHGSYEHDMGSIGVEWGGRFDEDHSLDSMAVTGEATIDLDIDGFGDNPSIGLYAGYVEEGYMIHVNANPTNAFWSAYYIERGIKKEDKKRLHEPSLTDTMYALATVSSTFMTNIKTSLYYIWLPGGGHEALLGIAYDSKKGFKWENWLGALTDLTPGEEFNSLPYLALLTRAVITF